MQFVSGVWNSLTGQSMAKRKRCDEEALPDRMTSLKLHANQCPGYKQRAHSTVHLPESSCNIGSSVATHSHVQNSELSQGQPHSFSRQVTADGTSSSAQEQTEGRSLPLPAVYTAAACSEQSDPCITVYAPLLKSDRTNSLHCKSGLPPSVPAGSSFTTDSATYTDQRSYTQAAARRDLCSTEHRTSGNPYQLKLHTNPLAMHYVSAQHCPATSAATADLVCCESMSPPDWDEVYAQPSLDSPDMALSESVADSPDDADLLIGEVTQATSPASYHSTVSNFLAVCKHPLLITALSKLHSCYDLPCGATMLPLPALAQTCPFSMQAELATAASAQARWSAASQLEWTVAALYALLQRAKLCQQELDTVTLLSILWILGE